MKYKSLLFFIFIISCVPNNSNFSKREAYSSKGFAYIYKEGDYEKKILKGKLDNTIMQVSNSTLRTNALIKIINPKTKDSIIIKNTKRVKYPEFYKILITEPVAEKLNIKKDLPFVEILEIKKNKSFVAKKAKIFNEEKKVPSKAPVTSVQISNISKDKNSNKNMNNEKIYILIASFYSEETAIFLKDRITKDIPSYDKKKLKIKKKSNTKIDLISGPYNTVNLMKNDYIQLKKFGFEELDITINE